MSSDDDDLGGNYYDDEGGDLAEEASALLPEPPADDPPTALDIELCQLPENDLANARRLELRHPERFYFTREWGPGVWDGRRFNFDTGEAAIGRLAQEAAARMFTHEAPAYWATQRRRREDKKAWEKRAGRFQNFCLQAGNNGRTEAMLKQAERRRTVALSAFDADPARLVVANGTLTLPSDGRPVQFEPSHSPKHLICKAAGAIYDPNARAPEFARFLERVMPDPEDRAFLRRWMGYCLTGHIGEQAYIIFQGKGGDGKSTFLSAFEHALGDYVANAAIETFLHRDKKGSDHSADIARLASGVRVVKASEPEQGARLAEAVLKIVTGGEPFPARAMYREPFEFTAAWKLIISCNRKPQIRGDDRGIWRRTLVLPWPVSIPDDEIDRSLVTKEGTGKLQQEASGILNWALEGWMDWLEHGLQPSPNAKAAKDAYRLTSNPAGVWFEACCDLVEGAEERADRLHKSYRGWSQDAGFDQPMNKTAFGRFLGDRNLGRRTSNGVIWQGVRLNANGEAALISLAQQEEESRFGPPREDD